MAGDRTQRLTCRDVIAILVDYLEATIKPDLVAAFDAHLDMCPECVAYFNTYRRTLELTGQTSQIGMPLEMRVRLRGFLLEHLDQRPDA